MNPVTANQLYLETFAKINEALHMRDVGRFDESRVIMESALVDINRIIAMLPDAGIYNEKGFVLKYLGRFEEALEAAEAAVRLAPNDPKYQMSVLVLSLFLNRSYSTLEKRREANAKLFPKAEKMIDQFPWYPGAYHLKAELQAASGAPQSQWESTLSEGAYVYQNRKMMSSGQQANEGELNRILYKSTVACMQRAREWEAMGGGLVEVNRAAETAREIEVYLSESLGAKILSRWSIFHFIGLLGLLVVGVYWMFYYPVSKASLESGFVDREVQLNRSTGEAEMGVANLAFYCSPDSITTFDLAFPAKLEEFRSKDRFEAVMVPWNSKQMMVKVDGESKLFEGLIKLSVEEGAPMSKKMYFVTIFNKRKMLVLHQVITSSLLVLPSLLLIYLLIAFVVARNSPYPSLPELVFTNYTKFGFRAISNLRNAS